MTEVRRAEPAQAEEIAGTLHAAFLDDPVMRWMFPDPEAHQRLQPPLFRYLTEQTFTDGEILTAAGGDAVSLWRTRPAGEQEPPDVEDDTMRAVFGEYVTRMATVVRLLHPRAPTAEPYLYLWELGVRPERRGAGLGSTLLRAGLERADTDGIGTYLEASAPRNRVLYERHGFIPLGDEVVLPDDGPVRAVVQPMWRAPR